MEIKVLRNYDKESFYDRTLVVDVYIKFEDCDMPVPTILLDDLKACGTMQITHEEFDNIVETE